MALLLYGPVLTIVFLLKVIGRHTLQPTFPLKGMTSSQKPEFPRQLFNGFTSPDCIRSSLKRIAKTKSIL